MPNEKSLRQNDVSRFLLGLGIGLVVGFIFKPPSNELLAEIPRECHNDNPQKWISLVIGAVPPVGVKTRSAQRHVAKVPKENNWMKGFSLLAGRRLNEAA